ncbi:cathelicidin-B1-like [Strigops habroptila]|uniref:cathelicidin-B1-like n=1 Tax=Strigops habroptila TaxID=2489341 RepID=UPI0011CEFDFE|nr:cathelicidin-B1-like [Strigops habroptila]
MRLCQVLPLLLLGLARATTPGPNGSTLGSAGSIPAYPSQPIPSLPGLWTVSYEDAVSAAVDLLNTRVVTPYVLRLREAQPQPGWPGDLQRRQELSFTVEETSCRAPGMATAACKSRWFGAVSWCRGYAFLEQQQPVVELSCEKMPIKLGLIRKSGVKDLFGRIKERFKGFFQCSKIWIRDKLNLKKPKS